MPKGVHMAKDLGEPLNAKCLISVKVLCSVRKEN
jgi:hypothetical protein